MNIYAVIVAAVIALAMLGVGFFWGKAVTEKQVRVETVQGPLRLVAIPGATIKCKSSTSSSTSQPSPGTHISSISGSRPSSDETVLSLEIPESLLTSPPVVVARPLMPDWRVSALGGYDFSGAKWSFGGGIERHIAGPFYGGAFGLSSGVIGVSISASF